MAHLRKHGDESDETRAGLQEWLEQMLAEGVPAHKLAEILLDYFEADAHIHLKPVESPITALGLFEGITITFGKTKDSK